MARGPKVRPRGESDLGRSIVNGYKTLHNGHATIHERETPAPRPSTYLLAIGGALIPFPFLFSELSFRSLSIALSHGSIYMSNWDLTRGSIVHSCFYATVLSSAILLGVSAASLGLPDLSTQFGFRARPLNRYKILRQEFWNVLGWWLLLFAAIQLGGVSVGCVVILQVIKAIDPTFLSRGRTEWLLFGAIWTYHLASTVLTPLLWHTLLALCALTAAALIPRSLFGIGSLGRRLQLSTSAYGHSTWIIAPSLVLAGISILFYLTAHITLVFTKAAFASACLGALCAGAVTHLAKTNLHKPRDILELGTICCTLCFSWQLCNIRSAGQLPLLLFGPLTWTIIFLGVSKPDAVHQDHRDGHSHAHTYDHVKCSRISKLFLQHTTPGTVVHSILLETDSRRIAYFGCLNLAFMLVQFFYGFATGSLGLLTDSIHMLFDCIGLAVGLAAAVMSKWPPTVDFPYGYGTVDTLSGFANGIFLTLVSVEIVFDAIHRLADGHELRRLNELLVVSILGLIVNLVGLTAFGHAHHHSHGHFHDHGHHDHNNSHDHDHKKPSSSHSHHDHPSSAHTHHDHSGHQHSADTTLKPPPSPLPPQLHVHSNDNMQGIFLHILADALGSASVIVSTLLIKYTSWNGWDPLASCIIAVLIFFSAIPLVKSSGSRLLLSLSDEAEYSCRGALQGISELRGVVSYRAVRFWMAEQENHESHHHGHEHHDHAHGRKHDHDDHDTCPQNAGPCSISGVIHVVAEIHADLDDVRQRTVSYFERRGMDIVVHVEKDGDTGCWCNPRARVG